jgi:hypothetical protein
MSITDSNFTIPIIFAEAFMHPFIASANKPFDILGIDKDTLQKAEYVVKLKSSERMNIPEAALRETLASLIAYELEIPTPLPAIIEISYPFVQTRLGFDDYQRFNQSIGVNYGNKFLGDNVIQFMPAIRESYEGKKKELQQVFIFDLFIENCDRRYDKPNLLVTDRMIYVIDHELAFGFVSSFLPNPKPWLFDHAIRYIIENHCLYANLKGKNFLANDFFQNFSKLNDTFWTTAYDLLPNEWKLNDFFKIRDYLCLKIEHINEFKNEIMEVLK